MTPRLTFMLLLSVFTAPLRAQDIALEVTHQPTNPEFGYFISITATLRYPPGHQVRRWQPSTNWKELIASRTTTPSADGATVSETRTYVVQALSRPEFSLLPITAELRRLEDGAILHVTSPEIRVPVRTTIAQDPYGFDPFAKALKSARAKEDSLIALKLIGLLFLAILVTLRRLSQPISEMPFTEHDTGLHMKEWHDAIRALPEGAVVPPDWINSMRDAVRTLDTDPVPAASYDTSDCDQIEPTPHREEVHRALNLLDHHTWSKDPITREELLPSFAALMMLEQRMSEGPERHQGLTQGEDPHSP
jgi:hypothetical protein